MTFIDHKTDSEKISKEKRKRSQLYHTLENSLNLLTYFDFFSLDAFNLLWKSKYYAFNLGSLFVTKEIFFLTFLLTENISNELIDSSSLNQTELINDILGLINKGKQEKRTKLDFYKEKPNSMLPIEISFSSEMFVLLEKMAEKALVKFKSPIISSEIIFLTLIEENPSFLNLLRKRLDSVLSWYQLRYTLLKNLHLKETNIRSEIPKNQQLFGYLLETQLEEKYFLQLLKKNILNEAVSIFRNSLIFKLSEANYFNCLKKETYNSIKLRKSRTYNF